MTDPSGRARVPVRIGSVVLTFGVLVALVLVAAPISFEAPFFGMYVTGVESPWVAVGSGLAVLLLTAICARTIVRVAANRWPDREGSFRIGVLAVPIAALCGLIVGLNSDWPPGSIAIVALPAAFAVSIGAATAWIARPR